MNLTFAQYDKLSDIFSKIDSPEVEYPSVKETEDYLASVSDDSLKFLMWLASVLPAPQTESEKIVYKMIAKTLRESINLIDDGDA